MSNFETKEECRVAKHSIKHRAHRPPSSAGNSSDRSLRMTPKTVQEPSPSSRVHLLEFGVFVLIVITFLPRVIALIVGDWVYTRLESHPRFRDWLFRRKFVQK